MAKTIKIHQPSGFITELSLPQSSSTDAPDRDSAIRYNDGSIEYWNGTAWVAIDSGAAAETIITTTGTLNNVAIATSFARFTGSSSVVLTGVDATGLKGKQLVIRNETGQPLTVKHNSTSSDAANRFYIAGEIDLPIADDGTAVFYYSDDLDLWLLSQVFGNSFSPQYIGDTGQVVTTVGDGTTTTTETVEIEAVRQDITEDQDSDDLNTLYPDAVLLQKVYCPNLTNGAGVYVLIDDINRVWAFYNITAV